MQILYTAHPTGHFARLLISVLDRVNVDGGSARHILALHVLKFKNGFVFIVEARFVQDGDTEVLLGAIGLRHLKEGVNLTDCRDVVRNERLNLSLQIYLLGLVPLDVLKNLFDLGRNGQISVGIRVISAWHLLLVLIIIVVISLALIL